MRVNPFLATGKRKPIVVGHRGVPKVHQENTLAGFRRAVQLGLDAIELDVRLTADGHAIVLHDHNLRRLTGSSFDADHLTWDQVSKLRIRRELPMGIDAHGAPVVVRYEREEPIPLLAEVLSEIGGKIGINIELKLDMPRWWGIEIGTVVANVIAKAGVEDGVIITSFDPRKLWAASKARPAIAHGFCFDDTMLNFARPLLERLPPLPTELPVHGGYGSGLRANAHRLLNRILETNLAGRLLGSRLVGAEHTLVGAETVKRLHAHGIAIGTHTIFPLGSSTAKRIAESANMPAEVERLVALGVDWIESDDPERLQKLIER
jgi:glycerophosphoryl diester phosphodiesterase